MVIEYNSEKIFVSFMKSLSRNNGKFVFKLLAITFQLHSRHAKPS